MIFRGTTPTITLEVSDGTQLVDMSVYTNYLTISDGMKNIDIGNSRMTFNANHKIDITLTQEETLSLCSGVLTFQLRAIANGNAIATMYFTSTLESILKEGIISET